MFFKRMGRRRVTTISSNVRQQIIFNEIFYIFTFEITIKIKLVLGKAFIVSRYAIFHGH